MVAATFCECAMVCVYGLMDRFVLTTRAFGEASSYLMMCVGVRFGHDPRHGHPFIKFVGIATSVISEAASV
jgi:hypothetical protein